MVSLARLLARQAARRCARCSPLSLLQYYPQLTASSVMTERPRYLRAPEIAERLNLSVRTIRRCIADGTLPSIKIRGARLVSEVDLIRMLNKKEPE